MRSHRLSLVLLLTLIVGSIALVPVQAAPPVVPARTASANPAIAFAPIGTYATGLIGQSAAEIVTYDPVSKTLYAVSAAAAKVDIISIIDPTNPTKIGEIDLSPYGAGVNSADFANQTLAVAVEANPKTDPGKVVFFDRFGRYLSQVTVGALPDMLTFAPGGRRVLVANEGEPNDNYSIDPEGTVSIIDLTRGVARVTQADVRTVNFRDFNVGGPRHAELDPRIRIFGPNATVAQDLEPEYITVSADGRTAWVTLQENNALAEINVLTGRVNRLAALGLKDHSLPGNGLDASDRDNRINIANWPVYGLYQPDAIASYMVGRQTFLITANEGDARDYRGYAEEIRVGSSSYRLNPAVFPNASTLKRNENLGRLTVSRASGDLNGDGLYDEIHVFGGRSFSIWTDDGRQVYDSGDVFEKITAAAFPADFNANNSENNSFDTRSDNKGPEPEGVAVGVINGRAYAFIGLERIGGVMIYDVTDPFAPVFVQYVNNRDFGGNVAAGTAGDLGPEGLIFIDARKSPNGKPLLVVANEVSGTITVFEGGDPNGAGMLTLLHNNDGESSLLPLQNNVGGVTLDVGGVATYKTLTDQQIRAARAARNSVVNVYAGDSFLASATLSCSLPPNPATTPVYDAVAQRQIAYDAHIFGNHEFDFGPGFLERFIRSFTINGLLTQPFLSANLDFSAEPGFADLLDGDGILVGFNTDGRVVARSAIITDKVTGQRFGVVGATTPLLPTISSPGNVRVTPDLPSTATVVQAEIDRLQGQYGVRKIIFVSHLQDLANDRALLKLLRDVDVAVGGGGDELLTNPALPLEMQLLPGELAPVRGAYPIAETDAAGRTVYLVTTAGNYKYLGRLDVEFDAAGEVARIVAETSYPRRVIPTSQVATDLGLTDAVAPDAGIVASVYTPVQACLTALAQPIIGSRVLLDVSRDGSRSRETNAGNLVADSYLRAYDNYAAANGLAPRGAANPVVAIQNGGGIRQNAGDVLPTTGVAPGTISRLDTRNVLAFFNLVTVVQSVTPADLKQIMERSVSSLPGQGGQFLQIGGFTVEVDRSRQRQVIQTDGTVTTPGERVVAITLADGTPIVANGAVVAGAPNVSVVTNDFTAGGGDNYPWLGANPNKTRIFDLNGVVVTYESVWVEYMLSFAPDVAGLPTIPAGDPRYAPGGEGRIVIR